MRRLASKHDWAAVQERSTASLVCAAASLCCLAKFAGCSNTKLMSGIHLREGCHCSSPEAFAAPRKKGPTKTVQIYCAKCQAFLYKYQKASVPSAGARLVTLLYGLRHSCPSTSPPYERTQPPLCECHTVISCIDIYSGINRASISCQRLPPAPATASQPLFRPDRLAKDLL